VFGFIPESVFAFIPEPRSESSRNAVRLHPGVAFAFARNPHKVNETKSAVARPQERKFLGFSFT
jgi:hypothetical protein